MATDFDATATMLIEPRVRPVGTGQVRRLLPYRQRRMIGPFIFVDVMGPEQLAAGTGTDVDAHPHIGLAAVTYLLEGRLVHRDSTGAVAAIEPGAVNWMTAGAGVTHTERSHPDDRTTDCLLHGLQTWVALPDETEDGPARFQHIGAGEVPTERRGASTVRVAVGSGFGLESPVSTSSPLLLAEIDVAEGSPVPVDATFGERGLLAIDEGITLNDTPLREATLAVLEPGAPAVVGGRGRAMVLAGEPVGPRNIWWNFVHSDAERIEQAKHDWTHQAFPTVPGDHDPWVPLPT